MSLYWDKYFLRLASVIAEASKDPSTKVGAVIIDEKRRPVSWGYNGFPRGITDSLDRLNNREKKLCRIIHAEHNAILFSNRDLAGCTLYTWPWQPCAACSNIIIQKGISRCVFPKADIPDRWKNDFDLANDSFREAGVLTTEIDLKETV